MKFYSPRCQKITRQLGIGLIELMISMLIGLSVMAGVVQMFSTTNQNAVATAGASRIQENIRYAFTRLAEDMGQAGNLGCFSSSVAANSGYYSHVEPVHNMLGLAANDGELYNFQNLVYGEESADAATTPAGLVTAGTDTFQIRYVNHAVRIDITDSDSDRLTVDTTHPSYDSLRQYQVVMASDCTSAAIFMITNIPGADGVIMHDSGVGNASDNHNLNFGQYNLTDDRETYFTINDGLMSANNIASLPFLYAGNTGAYQYFISEHADAAADTCDSATNTGRQNCALYRRENGVSQEISRGVHDMQVEYGWTDNAGILTYGSAAAVEAADVWNVVDRVKITLSFNSLDNAVSSANNIDTLLVKDVVRTFSLHNQL